MPDRIDSYGNEHFPRGIFITEIPSIIGPSQVLVPGPNGRIMQTSITSIGGGAITSVFGRTGSIIGQVGDYTTSLITEGASLYFTETRARDAISLTNVGTNTVATYDSITGVINIPTYSFTPLSRTITINGVTKDLSSNRSWTITAETGVTSFNARYGDVELTYTDVIDALGFTPISSYTEVDPTVPAFIKAISTTNISQWNTAYSWGNHALEGYLTISAANATYIEKSRYVVDEIPSGLINGTNDTFTIANTPITGKLMLFINGLKMEAGLTSDYTITGNTITVNIGAIPGPGDKISVTYIY